MQLLNIFGGPYVDGGGVYLHLPPHLVIWQIGKCRANGSKCSMHTQAMLPNGVELLSIAPSCYSDTRNPLGGRFTPST